MSEDIAKILQKKICLLQQIHFDKKTKWKERKLLNQLFEMNSREEIFAEIKNKKFLGLILDTKITPELME